MFKTQPGAERRGRRRGPKETTVGTVGEHKTAHPFFRIRFPLEPNNGALPPGIFTHLALPSQGKD